MFDPSLMSTPTRCFYPPTPPSSSLSPDSPGWLWVDKALDLASPERRPQAGTPLNGPDSGKRGRPRADVINHLILEGSSSPSGIKCRVCSRVFPREKSLQAHLRTHTGERPYNCDYPGCNRAFTQSGQLKTHQRLHAGEKPFICSSPGCINRYTHANRTCPIHPYHKPQRSSDLVLQPVLSGSENSDAVLLWLDNYRRDRQEKTPGKSITLESSSVGTPPTPSCLLPPSSIVQIKVEDEEEEERKLLAEEASAAFNRAATKRGLELDIENAPRLMAAASSKTPKKSSASILEERLGSPRKTLGDITTMKVNPVGSPLSSKQITPSSSYRPASTILSGSSSFKLKKRWLKEAFLEEERKCNSSAVSELPEEQLAMPIRWTSEDEPQRRSPKALVVANALVELSSSPSSNELQPLNLSLNSTGSSSYV